MTATLTTLDDVARVLLGMRPHLLYEEAARFDTRRRALADLATGFGIAMRRVDEAWERPARLGPYSETGARPARIATTLHALSSADYAESLRRAGDALLDGQQQVRELLLERDTAPADARAGFDHRSLLALHSVSSAFVTAGTDLPAPPAVMADGEPLPARPTLPVPPGVSLSGVTLAAAVQPADEPDPLTPPGGGGGGGGGGAPMGAMPMPMGGGMGAMPGGIGGAGMTGGTAATSGGATRQRKDGRGPTGEAEAWLESIERGGWHIPGRGKARN